MEVYKLLLTSKVLKQVVVQKSISIPPSYEDDFKRADLTFLHQRVWDPIKQLLVTLTPLPPGLEESGIELNFIGPNMDSDIARKIVEGFVTVFHY